MNILSIFSRVEAFLHTMRHSGTTSLLKKIASENDVWVLVAYQEDAKEFGDKAISISDIKMGVEKKPILFDNHTILRLTGLAQDELLNLTEQVRRREELISDIEMKIKRFQHRENSLLK